MGQYVSGGEGRGGDRETWSLCDRETTWSQLSKVGSMLRLPQYTDNTTYACGNPLAIWCNWIHSPANLSCSDHIKQKREGSASYCIQ